MIPYADPLIDPWLFMSIAKQKEYTECPSQIWSGRNTITKKSNEPCLKTKSSGSPEEKVVPTTHSVALVVLLMDGKKNLGIRRIQWHDKQGTKDEF